MGTKYVEAARLEFEKLYEESSPLTPVFFILSPGVDPLKDVEKLGDACFWYGTSSSPILLLVLTINILIYRLKAGILPRQGHIAQCVPGAGPGGGGRTGSEECF